MPHCGNTSAPRALRRWLVAVMAPITMAAVDLPPNCRRPTAARRHLHEMNDARRATVDLAATGSAVDIAQPACHYRTTAPPVRPRRLRLQGIGSPETWPVPHRCTRVLHVLRLGYFGLLQRGAVLEHPPLDRLVEDGLREATYTRPAGGVEALRRRTGQALAALAARARRQPSSKRVAACRATARPGPNASAARWRRPTRHGARSGPLHQSVHSRAGRRSVRHSAGPNVLDRRYRPGRRAVG